MVNVSQLVDVGFVAFTVFTCGYALFGNKDNGEARSKKWIAELSSLQDALRELIGEASAASGNLDRNLQKRKIELERLLQKIDTAQRVNVKPVSRPREEELPNESWIMETAPRRKTAPAVSPESSRQEKIVKAANRLSPANSELAKRIEVLLDAKNKRPSTTDEVIDPAAYKVARRLLEAGKEIHVVARKVGLPIEEIRVLDSMIREERGETVEPEPQPHIVRTPESQPAPTYSRGMRVEQSQLVKAPEMDSWENELAGLLEQEESSLVSGSSRADGIRRATTLL